MYTLQGYIRYSWFYKNGSFIIHAPGGLNQVQLVSSNGSFSLHAQGLDQVQLVSSNGSFSVHAPGLNQVQLVSSNGSFSVHIPGLDQVQLDSSKRYFSVHSFDEYYLSYSIHR